MTTLCSRRPRPYIPLARHPGRRSFLRGFGAGWGGPLHTPPTAPPPGSWEPAGCKKPCDRNSAISRQVAKLLHTLVYSSVKWETNVQQKDKGLAEILLEIKSAIQTPRFTKTFVQGICTDLQSRLTIVCHEEPSFGCPSRQGLTGSWPRAGLSLLRLFANEPVVSSST